MGRGASQPAAHGAPRGGGSQASPHLSRDWCHLPPGPLMLVSTQGGSSSPRHTALRGSFQPRGSRGDGLTAPGFWDRASPPAHAARSSPHCSRSPRTRRISYTHSGPSGGPFKRPSQAPVWAGPRDPLCRSQHPHPCGTPAAPLPQSLTPVCPEPWHPGTWMGGRQQGRDADSRLQPRPPAPLPLPHVPLQPSQVHRSDPRHGGATHLSPAVRAASLASPG